LNLTREIARQSDFRPLIQHAASASFPIPVNPGHKNHPRQLCAAAELYTLGQRDRLLTFIYCPLSNK